MYPLISCGAFFSYVGTWAADGVEGGGFRKGGIWVVKCECFYKKCEK